MEPHRLATSWRCHGIALLEPAQPFRSFSLAARRQPTNLRHLAGGCGNQSLPGPAQCPGGSSGSAFALSFSKTDALLDQLLGDAFGGNLYADDCLCDLSDCFHAFN